MAKMTSWDKLNQIKFQLFVSKTIQNEMAKISEALELNKEEWVTSKVLSERMPMLTADFIKKYGKILPRERVVYEEDGQTKTTRFMYPLKKIGRIIASGQLRQVDNDKNIVFLSTLPGLIACEGSGPDFEIRT